MHTHVHTHMRTHVHTYTHAHLIHAGTCTHTCTHMHAHTVMCGCSQRPGKSVGSPGFAGDFEVHEWVLEAECWSYGRAVSALMHCAPLQPSSPFLVSSVLSLERTDEKIANKTRKQRCGCMEAQCILNHPLVPSI